MNLTPASVHGMDEVYRHALMRLCQVAQDDARQLPLRVLQGMYTRVLTPALRSTFYWSAILSRPDLAFAGMLASTRIHEASELYRTQLFNTLPATTPYPSDFNWARAWPVSDIGLEPDYISLLGQSANLIAAPEEMWPYYKIGWRSQLLLEMITVELNGDPSKFRSSESRARYCELLELLGQSSVVSAIHDWVDLQGMLLAEVSRMASFTQVNAANAITALKQSRGYQPRELWRLTEQTISR